MQDVKACKTWQVDGSSETCMQIREMAACGLHFVDVPDGWVASAVVPYDPGTLRLDPGAAIRHLSNKHCTARNREWQLHQERPAGIPPSWEDGGWFNGFECSVADVTEYLFT